MRNHQTRADNSVRAKLSWQPTGRDQLWVVSTPVWYRIVGSIRLSDGAWNRRLTIRNSDIEAVGRQEVSTTFDNRSRVPIKVNMLVEGKELDWLWIGAQRRASTRSFEGQQWIVRTQSGARFLQRASTPRMFDDGHDRGARLRRWRPGNSGRPRSATRRLSLGDKVRVKFVNDSSQPVYIYKMKDGAWKYTKRIYAGRELSLEFEAGQHISLRHPWSGDEIEQFRAPSRNATHRIGRTADGRPGHPRRR